jgi:hypothetical protein
MKYVIHSIAFAAAAACAFGAFAQQTTKDGKRVGTRDELRACYEAQDAIAKRKPELEEAGRKRAAEAKELHESSEQLNSEVKHADDDNLTGLRRTRLERRVKEQEARVKAAQEADAAYQADVAAFEKSVEDYRAKCTNVAFDNDDVAAVKKEREAAGKK